MRVVVRLLSPCSVSVVTLIPCTHRMAQDVRVIVSSHPCMKGAFPLISLISSSPSSTFSHSSSTSSSSCCPSTSPTHSKIISSHSMLHRTRLDVPDTFSPFCSPLPQTTPTSRPLTGIRSPTCATSQEGRQSGHLAETLPHTGHESPGLASTSAVSTRRSITPRGETASASRTTVAASENFDSFHTLGGSQR